MKLYPASLVEMAAELRSGQRELTDFLHDLFSRIEETEPEVRALLPEADRRHRLLQEAAALSARWPNPADRPPLYGIPVGIKDLFVVDGFPTQAGSTLPPELFQGPEAAVVTRLREAGALILGKTALDEFAYAEPSPTRNPHNLAHTPGGSSSGSAAGVATGIMPLGIGTQTTRSITAPASFCGVVGFKPSYGRVPIDGCFPMSPSLDTVGFLTQDVASMELAASVLVPNWQAIPAPDHMPVLGVPMGKYMTYMADDARELFDKQVEQLQQAGYVVKHVEMPWIDYLEDLYPVVIRLLHAELAEVHAEWVSTYRSLYRPGTLRAITEEGLPVTPEQRAEGARMLARVREELSAHMKQEGLDLYISPSQPTTAPEGDRPTGYGGQTTPWCAAGFPTISLPAALLNNMPFGFQCIADFNQDEQLLAFSHAIARALV